MRSTTSPTIFAEAFFEQFLTGESVGIAVRNARLRLLEAGDPMGLVYVPFAHAGLRLEKSDGGGNA